MMNINDFIARMEQIAPPELQEEWDNSGWQIKLTNGEISKVMVALEVNSDVAAEAAEKKVDLLLVHHPLIFGKIGRIDGNDITGNLIIQLIRNGISVYSAHTNFDRCTGGNNDYFGQVMGFENVSVMSEDPEGYCRIGEVPGEGMRFDDFISYVSEKLGMDKSLFSYSGSKDIIAKKCGWCTGAGADFMHAAKAAGCDIYITGDVKYHAAQNAREAGINVLDCGHFATEQIFCSNIMSKLDNLKEIDIIQCGVSLNPFTEL